MAKTLNLMDYIDWARGECAAAGNKLHLDRRDITRNGCSGYFDEASKTLLVAMGDPDWPMVLAHELIHQRQMNERHALWDAADNGVFDDWLDGKRTKVAVVRKVTRAIQRIELDAERRAVVVARRWGLRDSYDTYIREANFTLWRYEIARRNRAWPVYGETREVIISAMPATFMLVAQLGKPPPILLTPAVT